MGKHIESMVPNREWQQSEYFTRIGCLTKDSCAEIRETRFGMGYRLYIRLQNLPA